MPHELEEIVDLDPICVEASAYQDRLADPDSTAMSALMDSISRDGQAVPIIVRSLGNQTFRCVCGHRRLEAARRLGIAVKSVVRDLTDEEAILLQGLENVRRENPTYIERAVFAFSMDKGNVPRELIARALAVDEPEISNFLKVLRGVPYDYVKRIGPAPAVGRPRWLKLAVATNTSGTTRRDRTKRVLAALKTPRFEAARSNERFDILFEAVTAVLKPEPKRSVVLTDDGLALASISVKGSEMTLKIGGDLEAFGKALTGQLPHLYSIFVAERHRMSLGSPATASTA